MLRPRRFGLVVLLAFLLASPAPAQKTAKEAEVEPDHTLYTRFHQPGERHRLLDALAGEWEGVLTAWLYGTPPVEAKARLTMKNQWVLEGHYLRTEITRYEAFTPEIPDANTVALRLEGFFGHDNVNETFYSIFFGTDTTIPLQSQAPYDDSTKTFTFHGIEKDPVTGALFKRFESFTVRSATELGYKLRFVFEDGSGITAAEGVLKKK